MADYSKIAWTDRTFNPWIGCTKVSQGCKFCYAETLMDHRYKKVQWGPEGERVRTSEAYWRKPLQWNNEKWFECAACGWRGSYHNAHGVIMCKECGNENLTRTRQRVFCASLADVFEDRPELATWRQDLFDMIRQTGEIDWLLLTKRIEHVESMIPLHWLQGSLPDNIWLGTSVEDQPSADLRIPELLKIKAKVKWLSVEPMIGNIWYGTGLKALDWVVVGGESGSEHRPMNAGWARDTKAQCDVRGVKFFMKQLGGYPDKLDKMSDFPEDLRVREFPVVV